MLNESLVERQSFEIHKSEGLDDFQESDILSAGIQYLLMWISSYSHKKYYKKAQILEEMEGKPNREKRQKDSLSFADFVVT